VSGETYNAVCLDSNIGCRPQIPTPAEPIFAIVDELGGLIAEGKDRSHAIRQHLIGQTICKAGERANATNFREKLMQMRSEMRELIELLTDIRTGLEG